MKLYLHFIPPTCNRGLASVLVKETSPKEMISRKQDEFLKLLEPVHDRLWRFVLSTTRDQIEAEDLLSETVLASYERFETLKDRQAFVSFLFTISI